MLVKINSINESEYTVNVTLLDIDEFGSVVLRNSGNDFFSTMFRDGLIQSLPVGQMDVDYLAYQPSVVYINERCVEVESGNDVEPIVAVHVADDGVHRVATVGARLE